MILKKALIEHGESVQMMHENELKEAITGLSLSAGISEKLVIRTAIKMLDMSMEV